MEPVQNAGEPTENVILFKPITKRWISEPAKPEIYFHNQLNNGSIGKEDSVQNRLQKIQI